MQTHFPSPWWRTPDPARIEYVLRSLGMNVKHSGQWFTARCPLGLHPDRHPSFAMRQDTGRWKCFSCGEHGDLPELVMALLGEDFKGAAQWLRNF